MWTPEAGLWGPEEKMGDFNAIEGNRVQDGDTRPSHRVDGDTGAGPGNDLVWEATVTGGVGG